MPGKPKVAKQVKEELDLLGYMVRWARLAFQVAMFFFIISLGYLLYGVFSGVLGHHPLDPRILGNVRLMGQVLAASSFLAAATFCFLTVDELAYAVLVGLVGAGIAFGLPIMAAGSLRQADAQAAGALIEGFRNAGLAMLGIVGLRILLEIVQQIRMADATRRAKAEVEAETGIKKAKRTSGGVWSPCWGLPYCHDAVREHCPAFKARRSCWRFGYGCNCDPSLIERLIRSGGIESGRGGQHVDSRAKATHAAYVRSDLQADRPVKQMERTIPCTRCPIYLDHQRQKFKIVNPLAIVAAIALVAVAYKPLTGVYTVTVSAIATLAAKLTYGTRVNAGDWFNYLNTPAIKIFFFLIVSMLVLAYVLKFVEWLIFEKKI